MPRAAESTIQLGDRADDYNDWLEDQQEEDDFDELERQRDGPSDATALLLNGKSTTTKAADAKDDDKKKDGVEKKPRKNIVRVNLDAKRLCGVVAPDTPATGLPTLVKDFADVKWLGSGHEDENLMIMMQKLEGWAHRMYPKFRFDDVLERVERLGSKREVRICVKRLMNGDPVRPEDFFPKEAPPSGGLSTDPMEIFPLDRDFNRAGKSITKLPPVSNSNRQMAVDGIPDDDDFDFYSIDMLDQMTGESSKSKVQRTPENPEGVILPGFVGSVDAAEGEEHISGMAEALDFINS